MTLQVSRLNEQNTRDDPRFVSRKIKYIEPEIDASSKQNLILQPLQIMQWLKGRQEGYKLIVDSKEKNLFIAWVDGPFPMYEYQLWIHETWWSKKSYHYHNGATPHFPA